MVEQMTEETVGENLTENPKFDIWGGMFSLTFFLLVCGWFLPIPASVENEVPGYIWFFSAAFQVIGTAIWIAFVTSIQDNESERTKEHNSIVLVMCFLSLFAFFIWFCVAK